MAQDEYDELAGRIRALAHESARAASPPPERAKVLRTNPLRVELTNRDLVLEEGDPDFEVAETLLPGDHVDTPAGVGTRNAGSLPQVGDLVVVHTSSDGDYVAASVVKGGGDDDG